MGGLVLIFLGSGRQGFLLPVSGDMETFSLESGNVILVEQEAVSRTAWEEDILEAEVPATAMG